MHLSPQQNKIIEILADSQWHCLTQEMYCKDDRTRISELRRKGFVFDESGKICDLHNHQSKLKLRRLISFPDGYLTQTPQREVIDKVEEWARQFKKEPIGQFTLPPTLF